jgi:PAS domain S-box-containing protein
MRNSDKSGKKHIEEMEAVRPRKAKLEHVSRDTSERKRTEEALRETSDYLQNLIAYANAPIIVWNPHFRITQFNRAFESLTGRKASDVIGKSLELLFPPSVVENTMKLIRKTLTGERWEVIEISIQHIDGSVRTVLWNSATIFAPDGKTAVAIIAQGQDISERKQAEEKLKQYQFIVESAHDAIFFKDLESRYIIANDRVLETFGLPRQKVIGKDDYEVLANKAEAKKNIEDDKIVFKTGKPIEITKLMTGADGKQHWFQAIKVPRFDDKGRVIGLVGIARDISERKKVEEKIENLAKFPSENPYPVLRIHKNGTVLYANKASEGLLKARSSGIGQPAPAKWHRLVKKTLSSGQVIREKTEHEGRVFAFRAVPIADSDYVNFYGADITDRKKAEDALRESEEKYRGLVENSPNLVAIYQEGTLKYVNKAMCERLGWTFQEMTSPSFNPIEKIISQKFQSLIKENIAKRLRRENISPYEVSIKTRNGSEIPVMVKAQRILYRGKPADEVIHIDITERKKAEQKLLDYQGQLRSLTSEVTLAEESERRRIAEGLHDQVSQSLAISKIELDALRHSVSPRDPGQVLKEVSDSLGKAIDNIRSLMFDLSFPILYELGFETAVAAWLTDQIQEKHGIATEFQDDEQPKPLDDDVRVFLFRDVRELLINVVKHAQAKKVKVSIRKVGSEMYVSVEDDGRGFDLEKIAATAVREGGIGLFSIRERLEHLGGHLEIESAPGRGCKVTMTAPLKQKGDN